LVFAVPLLVMGSLTLRSANPTAGYVVLFLGGFLLLFSLSYFRAAHAYGQAQKSQTTNTG
jgi:hypothetical protein